MMIPDQNIDPLFNDLKDLEISPSDKVWEGIEGLLDKKRKRLVPLYWWVGAAASVLLVIGFFIFNSPDSDLSSGDMAQQKHISPNESATTPKMARQMNDEEIKQEVEIDQDLQKTNNLNVVSDFSGEKTKHTSFTTMTAEGNTSATETFNPKLTGTEDKENHLVVAVEAMKSHAFNFDLWHVASPDTRKLAYRHSDKVELIGNKPDEPVSDVDDSRPSLRFVLGGEYSPTYAFRETSGGGSGNSESGINKAGGGISLAVKLNSRWQIETGVKYAMLGQEVSATSRSDRVYSFADASPSLESSMDITEINLSNSLGAVTPDASPSRMQDAAGFQGSSNELVDLQNSNFAANGNPLLEQNLGYVQVPLTIRYQLLKQSQLNLSLSGGVSTNWLVDNNAYLQMGGDKKRIGQTQGLADMGLSTHAGVAVSLPVFKGIHLRMEPRVDYFLSDVSKEAPGTFRPYSFGVFTGLFYEW
ncbi:outer membrane beta-barrel protein [Marinilabilia rubra]|uniref:Outer membrane protein beta-barrel domain-containing protein n=1 Tax=Marinilabilia rubra TaxID=2162893 RepID=A0A2U2B9N0_9BACT|nr:outer membrane beta-barrel protein [Marinilabilia rubra]PWD99779.1 hypothetical protein DDZ16_07745 [Marinilabilia rubra]